MNKKKAIYFFQYLPPWRIDVFNEMSKVFELTVVFWNAQASGFTYDRKSLLSRLDSSIETIFLSGGISAGTHSVRTGVFRIIRKIQPDVVFSHEYAPISMQCLLIRMCMRKKFRFVTTTSDNVAMADSSRGLKALSRKLILSQADGAILYSKDVESWYKKHFPSLKTDICPNIQNPDTLLSMSSSFPTFNEEHKGCFGLEGRKIMLFIGRLVQVKGLDLLLSAFAKVDHEGWKLVLVGDGPEKDNLIAQVKRLGIEDSVCFAGFYSGPELYSWYSMANFFILPSRYEPFGAVVNEALVYGCPVVVSRYIGALDFISEKNGLIFDPNQAIDFQKALSESIGKYSDIVSGERQNLMTTSFYWSVGAFDRITR